MPSASTARPTGSVTGRPAGVAHALQTAVLPGRRLPAVQAADVQVAVTGVEAAAGHAREEEQPEIDRPALGQVADLLPQDEQQPAAAVGQVQQLAAQWAEAVGWHP